MRLQSSQAPQFLHTGLVAPQHRPLTCPSGFGMFPNQGLNPHILHCNVDSEPTRPPGKSPAHCLPVNQSFPLLLPMRESQVVLVVKNLPANAGDKRLGFSPWVGKAPWRKARQPTPVFLPGKSHGQRSLAGSQRVGHD